MENFQFGPPGAQETAIFGSSSAHRLDGPHALKLCGKFGTKSPNVDLQRPNKCNFWVCNDAKPGKFGFKSTNFGHQGAKKHQCMKEKMQLLSTCRINIMLLQYLLINYYMVLKSKSSHCHQEGSITFYFIINLSYVESPTKVKIT